MSLLTILGLAAPEAVRGAGAAAPSAALLPTSTTGLGPAAAPTARRVAVWSSSTRAVDDSGDSSSGGGAAGNSSDDEVDSDEVDLSAVPAAEAEAEAEGEGGEVQDGGRKRRRPAAARPKASRRKPAAPAPPTADSVDVEAEDTAAEVPVRAGVGGVPWLSGRVRLCALALASSSYPPAPRTPNAGRYVRPESC